MKPLPIPAPTLADGDPTTAILIIAIITVLAAISIIASHHAACKRRETLRDWSRKRGYRFSPAQDKHFHKGHEDLATLQQGHSRAAFNTATCTLNALDAEIPARLGDYTYTIQAGKSAIKYELSYLLLTLPLAPVPKLCLRPERLTDRLNAALGFYDIDFEDAEFSRLYHVSSDDKRFAYDLLDPRMIEFLKGTRHPVTVEAAGRHLLITKGLGSDTKTDNRWSPDDFDERIAFAAEFLERWPTHLRRADGPTP